MAKHHIYPTPNPDGSNASSRLELCWQRDSGVQLASTEWAGEPGSVPDPALEYLPGTAVNTPKLAWDGRHVELTRERVNHLIKQLRIARDQAFGRDE